MHHQARVGVQAIVIGWALVIGPLGADTIHLNNGAVLEGEIVQETDETVVMKIKGAGNLSFRRQTIASIERSGGRADRAPRPSLREAAPPLAARAPRSADPAPEEGDDWRSSYVPSGGVPEEIRSLIESISTPGKEESGSIVALGRRGPAAAPAIPQLTRILAMEREGSVLNTAYKWMVQGPNGTSTQDIYDKVIVSKEAAFALALIGEEAVGPTLEALKSRNHVRRAYAAMSFCWNPAGKGNREVIEALTFALRDPEAKVRAQAAASLGTVGSKAVRRLLVRALLDPSVDVRFKAFDGLGYAGLDDDVPLDDLIAALGGADVDTRRRAAEGLRRLSGKIHSVAAERALREALSDGDAEVRSASAGALGTKGASQASAPDLEKASRDGDARVRREAMSSLGSRQEADGLTTLVQGLSDPDQEVRRRAAQGLGKLKDPRAVDALIDALHDKSGVVQDRVATALERLEDPRALAPLFESYCTRAAALKARNAFVSIGRKHRKESVPFLIDRLEGDAGVRSHAVELLRRVSGQSSMGEDAGEWEKWWASREEGR